MKKNIILIIAALLVMPAITGCDGVKNNSKEKSTELNMKSTGNQKIDSLIKGLKTSMEDYMKNSSPSYSQSDINECITLLSDYAISVYKTRSKAEAMLIIKSTILKLNDLNNKCSGTLIETNEREQIAEIIILVGNQMSYNKVDEDITEEWREW